ncbi:PP2C family protein-serine/threonine phosphatase [Aquipuribacter nitratireducens]|uniref:PP2C family protein-serine/threonine phosphatase n=1 Tax=Aquipuribacter nitratireducens TaxID=650104 RepID=A0ABW0GQU8_9MICO
MSIALRYAARSDIGLGRYSNNQDSGYAGPHLLAVADGMGGHAGGDVASSLAVGELAALDGEALSSGEAQSRLAGVLRRTNEALQRRTSDDPELAGMGTTVTALLRTGSRLILAHIGDSRAYLLRDGELVQVTVDHTYVQSLVDAGRITAEEAENHPQRNVVMRVLTGEHGDEPDLSVREGRPGDRWLLCSDGLSGFVSHETLHDTLAAGDDPATTADNLLRLALRGGGQDNITVVVADVVDLDDPPSTAPQVVGAAAKRTRGAAAAGPGDTPAQRAAALTRDAGDDEDDDDGPHGRRWVFWVVVAVLVAGLGGTVWGAWAWSQQQYFVGVAEGDDGDDVVAVYRGLPQDLGPISLSSVVETTDIAVDQLPSYQQEPVSEGITARGLDDARAKAEGLRQQPPASTPAASPTTEPTQGTAPSPATTAGVSG